MALTRLQILQIYCTGIWMKLAVVWHLRWGQVILQGCCKYKERRKCDGMSLWVVLVFVSAIAAKMMWEGLGKTLRCGVFLFSPGPEGMMPWLGFSKISFISIADIYGCSLVPDQVKHYNLARKICLFPQVLREHLENRRTKLLDIRRDDVSKPMALLDQIQAEILSLKELESGDTWTANYYVLISLDDLAGPSKPFQAKRIEAKSKEHFLLSHCRRHSTRF